MKEEKPFEETFNELKRESLKVQNTLYKYTNKRLMEDNQNKNREKEKMIEFVGLQNKIYERLYKDYKKLENNVVVLSLLLLLISALYICKMII